jgi:hypothetical protein
LLPAAVGVTLFLMPPAVPLVPVLVVIVVTSRAKILVAVQAPRLL